MIHVACVFVGEKYSVEYVHKLYRAVKQYMPEYGWAFNVLTDRHEPSFMGYRVRYVKEEKLPGYWNKILLFHPNSFPVGDRVVYLDLDVLVTGSLIRLLALKPKPFVIMRDPIMADRFNSSVMMWDAGTPLAESIWTRFAAEAERPYESRLKHTKGDQAWIEWVFRNPLEGKPQIPMLWDDDVVRGYYKPNPDGEKGWAKLQSPQGASVVVFHGAPRFHDEEMAKWVKEMWI